MAVRSGGMATTAEDLSYLWENFTLLEEESAEVDIDETDIAHLVAQGTVCVVGKLLADRTVGKEIIKIPLIRAWHLTNRVSFKTLGVNLFLIEFENECDKIRILEGRPWTFDGHLFALADYDGFTPPSQLEFDKAAFWVRMYNLPLACMGKQVGHMIGESVGGSGRR